MECGPPLDAMYNNEFDLLNYMFVAAIVGLLAAHLIVHLAPQCATFSVALNGSNATRVRSLEKPLGLNGLDTTQADRVRVGNALAEIAAILMQTQHAAGNHYELEQPAKSLMLEVPTMKKAMAVTGRQPYQRGACADGAPWRKPLLLITATTAVGRRLKAFCPVCTNHIRLRGLAPCGTDWTGRSTILAGLDYSDCASAGVYHLRTQSKKRMARHSANDDYGSGDFNRENA